MTVDSPAVIPADPPPLPPSYDAYRLFCRLFDRPPALKSSWLDFRDSYRGMFLDLADYGRSQLDASGLLDETPPDLRPFIDAGAWARHGRREGWIKVRSAPGGKIHVFLAEW
jgi:hypothetical protein